MLSDPSVKYSPYTAVPFPEGYSRVWPTKRVTRPPAWLSTDLRDGNQALPNPMSNARKLEVFQALLKCGFKEIEVAYPAASDAEYEFCRTLIEKGHIPDGVAVQIITPMIPALLKRSVESLAGAKHAIIHLYAATSPLFRQVVFRASKEETIQRAVTAVKYLRELTDEIQKTHGTVYQLNYCPETFSQTEVEFAVEICEAVKAAWGKAGTGDKEKIIFNMTATVEVAPPNHYADQVEYFSTHLTQRDHCLLSAHPHNDRGCGVAATELALAAGADRVEGCLFGHGERTGNVDLITLALNMYSQGVSPKLDFSDLPGLTALIERCTGIKCPERYPYSGKLVFAAFAGTHQDAIKKGFEERDRRLTKGESGRWAVPYIPIDPADLGCSYEAVIRVNSQSGRAGSAYLVKQNLGLDLPRPLQAHFGKVVQQETDRTGKEVTPSSVVDCFRRAYHVGEAPEFQGRLFLRSFNVSPIVTSSDPSTDDTEVPRHFEALNGVADADTSIVRFDGDVTVDGIARTITGLGNSPITAFLNALRTSLALDVSVASVSDHVVASTGKTASYVEVSTGKDTTKFFGVGVSGTPATARLRAVLSAANTSLPEGHIFVQPRRPRPAKQPRSPSVSSRRMEDLKLRAGAPPQTFDTSEWRQHVEA